MNESIEGKQYYIYDDIIRKKGKKIDTVEFQHVSGENMVQKKKKKKS